MSIIFGKGIKEFINSREQIPPNKVGEAYMKAACDLNAHQKKNSAVLYYLLKHGHQEVFPMFKSSRRSTELYKAYAAHLFKHGVPIEWEKFLKRDMAMTRNRIAHIRRIIAEDIKLTEDWCFFRDIGFKMLDESVLRKDMDQQLAAIEEKRTQYNAEHQEEIRLHMQEVQPLINALEAERERNRLADKAEREQRRKQKKEADAEVREIRKNNEKWKAHERMLEKDLERMMAR